MSQDEGKSSGRDREVGEQELGGREVGGGAGGRQVKLLSIPEGGRETCLWVL